jgi:predicted  nucleic acid-binding Zn-ribbon protein
VKEICCELRVQRRLNEEYSQQIAEIKSAFARDSAELEAISGQFLSDEYQLLTDQIETLKRKSQNDRRKLSKSCQQVSELKERLTKKDTLLHEAAKNFLN